MYIAILLTDVLWPDVELAIKIILTEVFQSMCEKEQLWINSILFYNQFGFDKNTHKRIKKKTLKLKNNRAFLLCEIWSSLGAHILRIKVKVKDIWPLASVTPVANTSPPFHPGIAIQTIHGFKKI